MKDLLNPDLPQGLDCHTTYNPGVPLRCTPGYEMSPFQGLLSEALLSLSSLLFNLLHRSGLDLFIQFADNRDYEGQGQDSGQ